MVGLARLKSALRTLGLPVTAARARLAVGSRRPPRFAGAFDSRAAALASLPAQARSGYDNDQIVEVSFADMRHVCLEDYPVVTWLGKLLPETGGVIDAGGHLGTKYLAFQDVLNLNDVDWTVYDLPAIVRSGRKLQQAGTLPRALRFADALGDLPGCDLVLASGVLQYLDMSVSDLIGALRHPPRYLVLNKVALRDGPALVTLEQIGSARVPYQIRNRAQFLAELASLGYAVRDSWDIPHLSHVIRTHPWHGASSSWGGVLERRETAEPAIVDRGQDDAA